MSYLMQLYAPIDDYPQAYHRVLYVFYCLNPKCQKSGKEIKVLRAQCSETQEFYKNPEVEAEIKQKDESKNEDKTNDTNSSETKIDESASSDNKQLGEKKSKHKKKKGNKGKTGEICGIDVISEKEKVTEYYASRIDQLLSGKKVPDMDEDEKEDISTLLPGDKDNKHEKELIKEYEKMQKELTEEEKVIMEVI